MMNNPTHPGEILKSELTEGYGLTIEAAAKNLGVCRATLSRVFNKRTAVSTDLAYRLELAGVGTAKFWLDVQTNYDLAQKINDKENQPRVVSFQNLQLKAHSPGLKHVL